jgi:hypothetical protein
MLPKIVESSVERHIEKLEHQNRLMRDALRLVEYIPNDARQTYTCPKCHATLVEGHTAGCIIGIALGR